MEDKKILKVFGNNIKILRTIKKISQDELLDKIGISKPYLSNIENGKNNLSLLNAVKISEALGKTLDEMIREIKV